VNTATVGAFALAAWSLLLVVVFPVRWLLLLLLGLWAIALTASYVNRMRQGAPPPAPVTASASPAPDEEA
jgi:steroid 5-alpha reductase family enzyme